MLRVQKKKAQLIRPVPVVALFSKELATASNPRI